MKKLILALALTLISAGCATGIHGGPALSGPIAHITDVIHSVADPLSWLANLAPEDIANMRTNAAADKSLVDPTTGINMGVNCADHLAAHLPDIKALFAPPPPPPDFMPAAPAVGPLSLFAAARSKADAGALYSHALLDFEHNKAAIVAAGIPIDVHVACAPYFNDALAGFRAVGH